MEQEEQPNEFEAVKSRLEEIAREVDDENLSLDDALDLYEEAVKLGLQASNLLEIGIKLDEGAETESETALAPDGVPGTNPDAIPDPTLAPQPNSASDQG